MFGKARGVAIGLALGVGVSVLAQPAQNAFNLRVKTDGSNYLITTAAAYTAPDSPAMNLANTRLKTDANGYLLTTMNGAQTMAGNLLFTPDNTYTVGNSTNRPSTLFAATAIQMGANAAVVFNGRSQLYSNADGTHIFSNNADTSGIRVQYAGVPTVGTCGTSPSVTAGSLDAEGEVNVGTGGTATACGITFNSTWTNAPRCVANVNTATAGNTRALGVTTTTTTAIFTAATAFVASDKVWWICLGTK